MVTAIVTPKNISIFFTVTVPPPPPVQASVSQQKNYSMYGLFL